MSSTARTAVETTGARKVRQRRADSRGVTALMYAAQQGNVDRVRKIIRDQSSLLFDRDRTGKSALHYCCTSDNVCSAHAADLLVMAAPDLVEEHDEDGFTPLHLAVIAGNMQLVTFLLANNADVNALDNEKHTVVHWATVCGETAALRAVLAAGAPVSTPDVHGGYPLHYAAQMCGGVSNDRDSSLGMQVLQTLLAHRNIDVSVTDGDKRQPLLWAASAGSAKAVLALVRAGAAVEAPDKDGLTALHCAASRGHTDCLDTLLTLCGASPDVIDSNGCTALHYAVTLGHADATALLLAHGADPNRQDRKGRSPAHCGCAKGQFETVKLIGSHGANLWLKNARGDLPLHEAAASGRRELVKWLLEMRPSQVNARNNDGRCPLHMAALNDNADMCKILLDTGAQVNPILRTSKNVFMTPLDCALQRGFRSTAKFLQLHGGVPASRLGTPRNQPVNSALNLQIRDDVTFWGDTSSDSEKEKTGTVRSAKKSYRKKIPHKNEKKKDSLSESEAEIGRNQSSKLESAEGKAKKKINQGTFDKKASAIKESPQTAIPSSKRSSSRKLPTSRIDYNNEIIINGKTEINIHQTNEIIIDKEPAILDRVSETVIPYELSEPRTVTEKQRRPRSAKYSKVKSGRSSADKGASVATHDKITSPETVIQQERKERELMKQFTLKDQSTNTSEETTETVIENKRPNTVESEEFTEEVRTQSIKLPDQQSLISNTSEDIENHKDLVVEASVHAPPQSVETELQEQITERKICETKEKAINLEQNQEHSKLRPEDAEEILPELKTSEEEIQKSHMQDSDNAVSEDQAEESIPQKESNTEEAKETTIDAVNKNKEILGPEIDIKSEVDATKAGETGDKESTQQIKISDKENDVVEAAVSAEEQPESKIKPVEREDSAKSVRKNDREGTLEKLENYELPADKEKALEGPSEQDTSNVVESKNLEDNIAAEETGNVETVEKTLPGDAIRESDKTEANISDQKEEKITVENGGNDNIGNVVKSDIGENKIFSDIETKQDITTEVDQTETIKGQQELEEDKALESVIVKSEKPQHKKEIDVTEEKQKVKAGEKPKRKKQARAEKNKENQEWDKKYEEYSDDFSSEGSSSSTPTKKAHKSFRVLEEGEAVELEKGKPKRSRTKKSARKGSRSRSTENKTKESGKEKLGVKRSKIPTPLAKTNLSKSDRHLDKVHKPERKSHSTLDARVPSLPNIHQSKNTLKEPPRPESNMSAPLLTSLYSDNERDSVSEVEDEPKRSKKRIKKRSKTRDARSAGSDYESSNLIDSGFEPSPRSTRIPKWKNMSDRSVNMTSVTQNIQNNIRRYHLERKIFQHLLELKRLQIRAGQHNEAVLVKRAIDAYHQSCASTVGAGRYIPDDFTFKSFEKFLYESLRKLQKTDVEYMKGLPAAPSNPLLCTKSTNRCMHATHAYTGVPCAAYLPKMDHHTIPKIGFNDGTCKPGTGFLPNISPKKAVTLELSHGTDKQVISLPADRLDQNKRYYVTFTVKGRDPSPSNSEDRSNSRTAHRHSKSD